MYQYWAYGLHINSVVEFPEMLPVGFDSADVTITLGKTPSQLQGDNVIKKVGVSASPKEYLLEVRNIARYYACNGDSIIIEPAPGSNMESIRLFMLGNAMAAILHQRNQITLHASGITLKDGVVLFTGVSGTGKSTTVCSLMNEGYPLFTDDVCRLTINHSTGKVEATASYPIVKLWKNTVEEMAMNNTGYKLRPDIPKFGFLQHGNFNTAQLPILAVYVLKPDNLAQDYSCKLLDKISAFNALQRNTYRRTQVDLMLLRQPHFEMVSKLASQADVFELVRPAGVSNIPSFVAFLKEQLGIYAES